MTMKPLFAAACLAILATGCDRDRDHPPADTAATPASAAPADAAAPPATDPAPAPLAPPEGTRPLDSGAAFAEMDTNQDGGLSLDELAATEMLHQHFAAADTDGNGQLSSLEVDNHRAQMAGSP